MFETIPTRSKKATLLTDGNVEFWVKNAWLRADGTLTPAGQKSYDEALNPAPALFGDDEFKVWEPANSTMYRYYFDDRSYIQVADRAAKGSYEFHRTCKGETFKTVTATAGIAQTHIATIEARI